MQIWFACLSPMFGTCHVYSTLIHFTKQVACNPTITCDANKTQYVSKVGLKGCPTQPTLPHEHCVWFLSVFWLHFSTWWELYNSSNKKKSKLTSPNRWLPLAQDWTGSYRLFLQPGLVSPLQTAGTGSHVWAQGAPEHPARLSRTVSAVWYLGVSGRGPN